MRKLGYLVFHYRKQIAAWWPGIKTNAWNAIVGASGLLGVVLEELKVFDFRSLLTPENAALAALSVAVIGVLLRQVTGGGKAEG